MSKLPSADTDLDATPLSPADRIRLVHAYITSTPQDGGLGIVPGCNEWDLVQSVMALHDHDFNEHWIRLWTRHRIASVQLEKIRDQVYLLPSNRDCVVLIFTSVSSVIQSLCTFFSSQRTHVPLSSQLSWASCSTSLGPLTRRCIPRSFSYGLSCSWSGGTCNNAFSLCGGAHEGRSGWRNGGQTTSQVSLGGRRSFARWRAYLLYSFLQAFWRPF